MRTATWANIGKSTVNCTSVDEVLKAAGLDYEVSKEPVYQSINGDFRVIPNKKATTRSDGHVYGVVSDRYEVIQNKDAFEFVKYMGDELTFEKAGETGNGMVYIIGKLPEVNVLGDKFTPYVLFRNGFDGSTKITACITPLRVVCQNQFNFAFKNTNNAITIRHTSSANAQLVEARNTLKMCSEYMEQLNLMAESFATQKITRERLGKIINFLFPIPEDVDRDSAKYRHLDAAIDGFRKAHNAEDNRNFWGTAWGVVNAYTDYITHKEPSGKREGADDRKFINTTFATNMNPVLQALEATF